MAEEYVDQVLTAAQLADRLGLSVWTIGAWRREGKGPKPVRINPNFTVYPMSEILRWERETGRRPA